MKPPPGAPISSDGRWWWDGTRWVALESRRRLSTSRRRVTTWVIAVVVIVAVALISITSLLAIALTPNLFGKPAANSIAITCDKPMLRPGGALDLPATACEAELSRQVAALSCDHAAGSTEFDLAGFDPSGKEDDAAVSNVAQAGVCELRVPARYSGALVSHATITNPAAVLDINSISGTASLLVGLRCTRAFGSPPCVFVRLGTDESYQCVEDRIAGQPGYELAGGSYAKQQFPAPALNTAAPNRLVVMLNGGKLVAYLNTRQVCSVPVSGQSVAAQVVFLVQATTDASIRLTRLVIGEAS